MKNQKNILEKGLVMILNCLDIDIFFVYYLKMALRLLKIHDDFCRENNIIQKEGTTSTCQLKWFYDYVRDSNFNNCLEIGYHMGHSCNIVLEVSKNYNKETTMTSLDFFNHPYSNKCLKFTKDRYGDKFNYMIGDSKDTLDSLIKDSKIYDLIFIDGCHEYSGVKSDLDRCLKLCHEDTVIIMDDLVPFKIWGKDVVKVWNEYIENNKLLFERYFFLINSFLKFIKNNQYINNVGNHDINYFIDCFLNNKYHNLRITDRKTQEQNSKGIKENTKRERKYNAKPLPDGLTQEMMKKYVVYYSECYNKEKNFENGICPQRIFTCPEQLGSV